MKKFVCIVLTMLAPMLLLAQETKKEGPKKETISTYRVFAKDGHTAALKAAIAAHAQKFHTGSWKWRVSEVLTGPDGGAFMLLEGPASWTEIEGRGDLGAEHMKDYETNIAPHVEKATPDSYATYVPEASTVAAGAFSTNKVLITRIYFKPGRAGHLLTSLKNWKKVWEKQGVNVAVWRSFYSGEGNFSIAGRLKNGFKDLDEDLLSARKAADEVLGAGGFDRLQEEIAANTERSITEIIEFKPELSSK